MTVSDNRWQGYSHAELYAKLNSGPGASASGPAADVWGGMAQALDELQSDLSTGISASGASWTGAAGDAARDALGPLSDWALQASAAADLMRISTELQGSLLGKARADMPAPVQVTAEQPNGMVTALQHLLGEQTDHEIQEAAANAAEQRAFQVMAQYESGTGDNTSTLGDFGEPPQVVVDSSPVAAQSRVRVRSTHHTVPRTRSSEEDTRVRSSEPDDAIPGQGKEKMSDPEIFAPDAPVTAPVIEESPDQ